MQRMGNKAHVWRRVRLGAAPYASPLARYAGAFAPCPSPAALTEDILADIPPMHTDEPHASSISSSLTRRDSAVSRIHCHSDSRAPDDTQRLIVSAVCVAPPRCVCATRYEAQEEEEKRRERRGGQAVARDLEMIICFLSGGGERASGAGGDGELAR